MTVETTARRPRAADRWRWRAFAAAALIATVVYMADVSSVASTIAMAVIGLGTIWAAFTGPRRFGAEPRSAWLLIGAGSTLFLIGVVLRPFVSGQAMPW